ncbi:unnamed protein product, partial [Effrenium voratum]
FVAHQHSDDQLLIQERILAKDADVKSPHAVINWALMLDQLSAQFELDFGVTLTGSFMPHGTSASKMGRGSFQAAPEAWPQNETQPSGGGVADMLLAPLHMQTFLVAHCLMH